MAQADIVQQQYSSVAWLPEERKIDANLPDLVRISVKKIRSSVYLIIHDEEGSQCIIDAKLFQALYAHYESIQLLISVIDNC